MRHDLALRYNFRTDDIAVDLSKKYISGDYCVSFLIASHLKNLVAHTTSNAKLPIKYSIWPIDTSLNINYLFSFGLSPQSHPRFKKSVLPLFWLCGDFKARGALDADAPEGWPCVYWGALL